MEPAFSPAWFETFGRPEPAVTTREIAFLERVLPPPPARVLDVAVLGRPAGLTLAVVAADFAEKPPSSETPRTQLVFRRDT